MPETRTLGRFVWHELMTSDVESAKSFYPRIIDLKTQAWEKDPSYTLWVASTGPVGGLMRLPDEAKAMGAPPCWLFYVGTPDIDATVQDVLRLGGTVLKGVTPIPDGGRFAVLTDPQGAQFCLYSSSGAPPMPDAPPRPGEFSWHELATTDIEAALRFYQELFGWENTGAHDMGAMGIYQMFGWGGRSVGGMFKKPAEMPAPPHWLCYIMVKDAAAAAEAAKSAGGKVINGPMEVPGGDWIAQIIDPQGAAFAVHSMKKQAAAEKPSPTPAEKPKPRRKPVAKKKATPAKKRTAAKTRAVAKRSQPAKKTPPARKPARRKKAKTVRRRRATVPARRTKARRTSTRRRR